MAANSNAGVILVVEDASISRLVKNVLTREGREVLVADAERAVALLERDGSDVKLLITNRPQAFERLDAPVPLLYVATAPDWDLAARTPGLRVLRKPFHPRDLVEAVDAIMREKLPGS